MLRRRSGYRRPGPWCTFSLMPEEPEPPPEPQPGDEHLREAAELVRRAFWLARDSGKEDWRRMYAGVLKNRMLLLKNGESDPTGWGGPSFTGFLEKLPEVVSVDRTVRPPMVELVQTDQLVLPGTATAAPNETGPEPTAGTHPTIEPPASDSRDWRIRRDLWDAVMAVRDPDAFLWRDGSVLRVPQDQANESPGVMLPTLTGPDLDEWQRQFAEGLTTDPGHSALLTGWKRGDIRTANLPPQVRHAWYAYLKRSVRSRLEEWFAANTIPIPADLVGLPTHVVPEKRESTTSLRALVVACVEVMTEEELEKVWLPPRALLRVRRE